VATEVTIVRAAPEHLDAVRRCAQAAYAKYVGPIGREPAPMIADFAGQIAEGWVDVALDPDARVIGFIVGYPRQDHLHVENLAISPAAQGAGVGTRLLRHAEARARELGLAAIELYTNAKMTEALAFYPARGFVEIDRRREAGFDRVYFRKHLSISETRNP
jgi:ribosomal protein S18 acetylase RimI-like enzyme